LVEYAYRRDTCPATKDAGFAPGHCCLFDTLPVALRPRVADELHPFYNPAQLLQYATFGAIFWRASRAIADDD
jgi:hypothetical protein